MFVDEDAAGGIPFMSAESKLEDAAAAVCTFLAAETDAVPGFGLVASSSAFRDAIACSCVAFSSTLPANTSKSEV